MRTRLAHWAKRARRRLASMGGATLAENVSLSMGVRLRCRQPGCGPGIIEIGEDCDLRDGVIIEAWGGHVRLHRRVFMGPYVVIYGHGGVEIGDETLIAMHCRIVSSNHTVPPAGTDVRSQPDILLQTKIGRDVWLGAGVTVLGGVQIGDGCVVGAGAVVTRDLPANSLAVGVPARITGSRAAASR